MIATFLGKCRYPQKSKLRWRTPLQATGYICATAPNSVKGDNNPKQFSLSRS
jgi:hypothetical protein